jgi:hypothetical protein
MVECFEFVTQHRCSRRAASAEIDCLAINITVMSFYTNDGGWFPSNFSERARAQFYEPLGLWDGAMYWKGDHSKQHGLTHMWFGSTCLAFHMHP